AASAVASSRDRLLLPGRLAFRLRLELLHRGQRAPGVFPGLVLAARTTEEHRPALEHQLDRLAHRAEPVALLDGAVLLGFRQPPVLPAPWPPHRAWPGRS